MNQIPDPLPDAPDVVAAREAAAARRAEIAARIESVALHALPIVVVAAVTILAIRRVIHDRGLAVDDAYIVARYAANLGAGLGFRWNASSPPCEGFTSTMQVVLLMVAGKLGAGPLGSVAAIGAAAIGGLATLLCAVARPRSPWFALAAIPALAFAASPDTVLHASRGLETALFAAVSAFTVWLATRAVRCTGTEESGRRRAGLVAGASAFACILTGPEGAIVAIACVVTAVVALRRDRDALRALLPGGAALTAAVGLWLGWKVVYFGDVFPTEHYVTATSPGWSGTSATSVFVAGHWPILIAAFAASAWAWWREFSGTPATGAAVRAPFACLAFPLIALPWFVRSAHVLHETGIADRVVWPVMAVACLAAASAAAAIPFDGDPNLPGIASLPARSVRRGACIAFAAVAIVTSGGVRGTLAALRDAPARDAYVATCAEIGHAIASVGRGDEIRVVTHSSGALPYYAGAHHVDTYGRATAEFSTRVPEADRMRLAVTIPFDVNVSIFPAAQEGAANIAEDVAILDPAMVQGILRMGPDVARRGVIADAARWPVVVHDQMRMLRDRATLAATVTLPVGGRLYVHVAKDSPHRAALVAALSKLDSKSGGGPR